MVKSLSKDEIKKFGNLIKDQMKVEGPLVIDGLYICGWTSKRFKNVFDLTHDKEHGISASTFDRHYRDISTRLDDVEDIFIFPDEKEKSWRDYIEE